MLNEEIYQLYFTAKEEEMIAAGEEKRVLYRILVQKPGVKRPTVNGRLILNWTLNQQDISSWNG